MSVAPAMAARLDNLPADYVSVRFVQQVTFRGVTTDSVAVVDTVAGVFRLTHMPLGILVQWWPGTLRPLERQVRLVPWHNIACVEPSTAQLERMLDAHDASRTKPAPPKQTARAKGAP